MKKTISVILAAMMLWSSVALADAPTIPDGTLRAEVVRFTEGQLYPVYSAPDTNSLRGHGGRAVVSTSDWVQVFGSTGDWIMVQYDITDDHYRIGYISRNALPTDTSISELSFTSQTAMTSNEVEVTDDPLKSKTRLALLPADTNVTILGSMGDWSYIAAEVDGEMLRGFVTTAELTRLVYVDAVDEAGRALDGTWTLYAGNPIGADALTFGADGTLQGTINAPNEENNWNGVWSLRVNDSRNDDHPELPEFILSVSRSTGYFEYGLRICRQITADNTPVYALILSDLASSDTTVFNR